MKLNMFTAGILKSPFGILAGICLGLLLGIAFPSTGDVLGPLGDVFINLMKMCILPIIITSISISLAQFLYQKMETNLLKLVVIFISVVVTCSAIGVGVAALSTPGKDIDPTSSESLKDVVDAASMTTRALDEPIVPELKTGIYNFLIKAIPKNIFSALAEDRTFQIIIFSIIFGIALGIFTRPDNILLKLMDTVYNVFLQIFDVILILLPFAILCLMARDAKVFGTDTLTGMAGFIIKFYIAFLVLFILSTTVIMIRTQTGLIRSMKILQYPIFISMATQSSIAAIPAAINSMQEFGFNKSLTNILIPPGTVLGRFGNILYFGFSAVFVAQLYNIPLGFMEHFYIIILSVFAGISTSGQTGTLTLPMLGLILDPLGVPFAAVYTLLAAVDPIIDMGRTMSIVHTNCAMVSLIAPHPSKPQPETVRAKSATATP